MTGSEESEADRVWREKVDQAGSPRSCVVAFALSLSALLVLFACALT